MQTRINIIDENYEGVEVNLVNYTIPEVLTILEKTEDIKCGTERFRHPKTDYMAVDFLNNEIEIQVKFEF
jgi:hypothetical protein